MESHSAKPAYEYQPTIIETRFLIERLAIQIALLRDELKRNWIECKRNPCKFLTCLIRQLLAHLKRFFIAPYVLRASSTAITAVTCLVVVVLLVERTASKPGSEPENADRAPEVVMLNVERVIPKDDSGFGKNGNGRVGLQRGLGCCTPIRARRRRRWRSEPAAGAGWKGVAAVSSSSGDTYRSSDQPTGIACRRHRHRSSTLARLEGAGLWRPDVEV
jgi:hypothetical protein